MLSPSNEDHICAMFDSFCKTMSRNFVRNLDRAEGNRDKHFCDEPVDYLLETLGRRIDKKRFFNEVKNIILILLLYKLFK